MTRRGGGEEMKPICPMMMVRSIDTHADRLSLQCMGEECAWWDEELEACAVRSLLDALDVGDEEE